MQPGWRHEAWALAGLVAAGFVLGAFSGRPFAGAAVGLSLYLAFSLRNMYRLYRWLASSRRSGEVPDANGAWGEVFDTLRAWRRESERSKDHLTGMLERFQSASGAMPDAMVVLSQYDEIEWANSAAARLLGIHWPRDQHLRVANLVRNPLFHAYLDGGEFADTLTIPCPVVPEYALSLQIIPFGASQKLLMARDVTRLVRLEQVRQNFVANVSHELRTPVTVLAGFIETLRDASRVDPTDLHAALSTMHEQAQRMQRLVDDLLTLSRLETAPRHGREETVNVAALLTEIAKLARILSGDQAHVITLEVDANLLLRGDREELRSAFSNIVNNAVRYTPARGHIQLRWHEDADAAKFSVSDDGEGIAPQHLPHLTERFYRVDTARSRSTGGTGLGLSIVKHVLLRHDAHLEVQSRLGHGSTFTCLFPLDRASHLARPAANSGQ